jgi:hypothetical protein
VTPRALKRLAWVGAALAGLAVASLVIATGDPPDLGLAHPDAAGPMVAIPVEHVTAVEVHAGKRHWRFERADGRWRAGKGVAPTGFGAHVDAGLRFLHASAPDRRLPAAELEEWFLEEAGLDPPLYVVSARTDDARTLTVAFGMPNPHGLAQYARVGEDREVLLLPRYVGEAWEAATGLR